MAPGGAGRRLAALALALAPAARGLRVAPGAAPSLDLVVAAEGGHLDWINATLKQLPGARLRLYCRGAAVRDPRCLVRTQKGSVETLMLRHILDHYDNFSEVTLFTHDHLEESPPSRTNFQETLGAVSGPDRLARFPGFHTGTYFPLTWAFERPSAACRASASPYGEWYRWYINRKDPNLDRVACTAASVESIFAVSAARLRRLPRTIYLQLLEEVGRCSGSVGNNPGEFLSKSWSVMYSSECHQQEAYANLRRMQARQPPPPKVKDRSLDLVVATYRAPLDWITPSLQKMPTARLHLYCKGEVAQDPRCIRMDNVGTEEYAYFHHILNNWDNLADITIFTIDNMENAAGYKPTTKECLDFVINKVDSPQKRAGFPGYEAMDFMPVTKKWDLQFYHASATRNDTLEKKELCRASVNPFGPWYLRFINSSDTHYDHLSCSAASMHGIFAVSRERIRRLPKSLFEDLVKEVEKCRGVNHFVAGHYMERSWSPLFSERCHIEQAQLNLLRRTGTQMQQARAHDETI